MACDASYGSALGFSTFWCINPPPDAEQTTQIEAMLSLAASDVNAARAAQGACDCTLATWADVYLSKLAYIEAAVMYNCPCGRAFSDPALKRMWLDWVTNELNNIRLGKIELCAGETATDFPSLGFAERNLTPWSEEQIIYNTQLRNP